MSVEAPRRSAASRIAGLTQRKRPPGHEAAVVGRPHARQALAVATEKPRNGLAGLKHWRYDLRSGFTVAMISLPFSMGIAMTSGAPPICGIMSAIIAGFILPFLGGSYVTISGPAAGLAPALFAGMIALGHARLGRGAPTSELLAVGYPLVLVAIAIAGVLQVILAKLKVARLSAIFPAAAIQGMLAAIGLMIIVKQIPLFMGVKFEAHEFWAVLGEVPSHVSSMHPQVCALGIGCLAALFVLAALPGRLLKIMPPPVWVFLAGTMFSTLILKLDKHYLINVPDSLEHGIVFPQFGEALTDTALLLPLGYLVVTLLLIDATESLATIAAVDNIDPYRRRSDPDRTLLAMGVSNGASSMLGGLTIIPGMVKSTANVLAGGRTQWANFYNACFLLTFVLFGRYVIDMVPMAVLGAILVFIGYKLCKPAVWFKVARVGTEQFVVFATTLLVTVTTDLLMGIVAGIVLELVLNLWYVGLWHTLRNGSEFVKPNFAVRFLSLFRNPVSEREFEDGAYHLYLDGPLVCFNLFHVIRELRQLPSDTRTVHLHLSSHVPLVDHTTGESLRYYLDEFSGRDQSPRLVIEGWDHMRRLSKHETSTRIALGSLEKLGIPQPTD
ncbi:SulP family inorganic anion transporter [Mycobacterium sp. 663a-19]|uniref:SulP family inorganic anion transporter n=1 Tax=Mycobacterium sp. 663a-19 TaxID=2986148 RepID=UPI002D1EB459|nr:SulP family inorganic anion transporter [Mycobacterium sp. 663a-19]MEB3983424.1 SulP family inorganic anion transporter [Mycobacterium sp. 663a-19]